MNKKIINFIVLFAVFGIFTQTGIVFGASNYSYTKNTNGNSNVLQGSVVYTPTGIITKAVTTQPISSETTYQGQSISTTLPNDLMYGNMLIAPAGSVVSGTVIAVENAGRANRNGSIFIRFNSLTTPQGYRIPISAVIKTDDKSGVLKGGTKVDATKDYAINTGIGAGAGVVAGTAIGALAGGSVGKGAIYGTVLGAGSGLVKGLFDKGNVVEIPADSTIELYFDQPITISAPKEYNY